MGTCFIFNLTSILFVNKHVDAPALLLKFNNGEEINFSTAAVYRGFIQESDLTIKIR